MLDSDRGAPLVLPLLLSVGLGLAGCDFLGLSAEKTGAQKRAQDQQEAEKKAAALTYVGREKCGSCHEEILQSYAWSAHDRSLDLPERDKVAAPFLGERASFARTSATFATTEGRLSIRTDKDHPVVWTIGYEPIQQYLVPGARGRIQALPIGFDSRQKSEGGQRWYSLDATDAKNDAGAHFSSGALTWNSTCADCHSTRTQKNYRFDTDSYDTKFAEIDVSCEACHGPASRHIELAQKYTGQDSWPATIANAGFDMALATYALRRWVRGPDDKIAKLEGDGDAPPERTDELTSCAPCHSHRVDFGPVRDPGPDPFDDRYLLSLLSSDLYFANGQIKGDAYSYGSFVQSSKHAAGVVCSDCHNPHSATLRQPTVDLCVSCHDPGKYHGQSHTMHKATTEITCADCHMPERVYAEINSKRDHSFSIPRPDLTLSLGTPSACDACHPHRPQWAALSIEKSFGRERGKSFAPAFFAAERGNVEAPEILAKVLFDKSYSAIVRASALDRWAQLGRATPALENAIEKSSRDDSVLLRRAAAEACWVLPPEKRMKSLETLSADSARTVRVTAALCFVKAPRFLVAPPADKPPPWLEKALIEAKATQLHNADSAGSLLNLASIESRWGNPSAAETFYRAAAERFSSEARVFIEWAEALEGRKKSEEATEVLARGLKLHPKDPFLMHARGMSLVRQKKVKEALPSLQGGFEKAPRTERKRFGYAYAVAVQDTGDWAEALAILRILKREYPEAEDVAQAIEIYEKKRSGK